MKKFEQIDIDIVTRIHNEDTLRNQLEVSEKERDSLRAQLEQSQLVQR